MPLNHFPGRAITRAIASIILAGLAGTALVRFSPGFGLDERTLDARLSPETRRQIEHQHDGERNAFLFYKNFLSGALHGDFGTSIVFGEPISQLIRERTPLTFRMVTTGLGLAWPLAILMAVAVAPGRRSWAKICGIGFSGTLLSISAALLATICLLFRLPPACAIAAVVFPRIFPHIYEQIRAGLQTPHVNMARAKGLGPTRVMAFHVAPIAIRPLVALVGISVPLAFGAAMPVEALADLPGLGQLAWRAALGRDIPVLVTVTLLLTFITVAANLVTDWSGRKPAGNPGLPEGSAA